jgi:rhodanese-related sulfurtransferase
MSQQVQLLESLFRLQPIGSLPAERARELAALARSEFIGRGGDVLAGKDLRCQSVYLLRGELRLLYDDGSFEVVVGGSELTHYPLGRQAAGVRAVKAITDVELVSFDDDVLDAMLTWDQLSGRPEEEASSDALEKTGWYTESTLIRVQCLARGLFPALPQSSIDALLSRAKRFRVHRGQTVVREGDAAAYYYVIEAGRCRVSRKVGGGEIELAELNGGDAFGEDALIEGTPYSASAAMLSDGTLLRISRDDFIQLLREPLLQRVSRGEAEAKVRAGAVWVDVRFPAEYAFDKIPGAINIPLNEIRNATGSLDASREYVTYCQSGKRSSGAAFLLLQRGYRACVLKGGLRGSA